MGHLRPGHRRLGDPIHLCQERDPEEFSPGMIEGNQHEGPLLNPRPRGHHAAFRGFRGFHCSLCVLYHWRR